MKFENLPEKVYKKPSHFFLGLPGSRCGFRQHLFAMMGA
jgi:hypothetical protein